MQIQCGFNEAFERSNSLLRRTSWTRTRRKARELDPGSRRASIAQHRACPRLGIDFRLRIDLQRPTGKQHGLQMPRYMPRHEVVKPYGSVPLGRSPYSAAAPQPSHFSRRESGGDEEDLIARMAELEGYSSMKKRQGSSGTTVQGGTGRRTTSSTLPRTLPRPRRMMRGPGIERLQPAIALSNHHGGAAGADASCSTTGGGHGSAQQQTTLADVQDGDAWVEEVVDESHGGGDDGAGGGASIGLGGSSASASSPSSLPPPIGAPSSCSGYFTPDYSVLPPVKNVLAGSAQLEDHKSLRGGVNGMCSTVQYTEEVHQPARVLVKKRNRECMHTVAETLADQVYASLGYAVPESRLYHIASVPPKHSPTGKSSSSSSGNGLAHHKIGTACNGDVFRLSRFIHSTTTLRNVAKWSWDAAVAAVSCGYVADALVCNRDLIDPQMGNVIVQTDAFASPAGNRPVAKPPPHGSHKGSSGAGPDPGAAAAATSLPVGMLKVWRMDNGSAFHYRASGKHKGAATTPFDPYPTDVFTIRTRPGKSQVYGHLAYSQVMHQCRHCISRSTTMIEGLRASLRGYEKVLKITMSSLTLAIPDTMQLRIDALRLMVAIFDAVVLRRQNREANMGAAKCKAQDDQVASFTSELLEALRSKKQPVATLQAEVDKDKNVPCRWFDKFASSGDLPVQRDVFQSLRRL